jgi:putative nucleotidyltransferase with HDIG domain
MTGAILGTTQPGVLAAQPTPGADPPTSDARIGAIAGSLHAEFSAPIGVLDAANETWRAVVGATETCLPRPDGAIQALLRSPVGPGKVAVWREPGRPLVWWLVLPLSAGKVPGLVAFAGFREPARNAHGRDPGAREENSSRDDPTSWGPECPEPALLAWGRQALGRLGHDPGQARPETRPETAVPEESDHVVIGRLIRRMRISESPRSFQALATNVLRSSLGMAAVAWIPSDTREEIVVSGSIEGLRPGSYRELIPTAPREAAGGSAESRMVATGAGTPPVRGYASVAAGSAGWLVAANHGRDRPIGVPEIERMQYVASLIATQASNARIYAELKDLLFGIIRALTAAIDAKDPYTSGHSERVARIAVRLAEELEIPPPKRSDLYLAGLLHDIGKIGIDDVVLKKTGPLTSEEYRKIQSHVEIGVTILKDLKKLSHIIPGVRHHHESMDGSGYPDKLSGEDIPLEARILAVADSFDAMSSNRPYRRRLTPMQIDDIFRKGRGVQWDPKVVDALFGCRMDVEAIRQKGLGESLIGAVNLTLGRG